VRVRTRYDGPRLLDEDAFRQDQSVTTSEGTFPSIIRLTGSGLHLREWTDDDLPVMVELFDDPQFDRWTPLASPFDLPAAQAYLSRAREQRNAGRVVQLAVTTDGHAAVGEVLLVRREEDGRQAAELAYGIGAKYRRQRLAARAVELMTRYARNALAIDRVILRIAPENTASEAVARITGFYLTDDEPIVRERPNGRSVRLRTWAYRLGSSTSAAR
jgi:RimJ/RimL family protein N-acetyltransferase